MNFISGALGNKDVAKVAGQKAGELVEQTVKSAISGKGKGKGEPQKTEAAEGNKEGGGEDGFGLDDALAAVGGKKEGGGGGGGGGLDVKGIAGGLFK